MADAVFYRGSYTTLWFALDLGALIALQAPLPAQPPLTGGSTTSLVDYFAVPGQLTLRALATQTAYSLPVSATSTTVVRGNRDLAGMPNGEYQVQGRFVDAATGHPITLGACVTQAPGDTVVDLRLQLLAGLEPMYSSPLMQVVGGLTLPVGSPPTSLALGVPTLSLPEGAPQVSI